MSVSVRPIKIAIMALGGQGGGVLADWIIALGERAGFQAQATSVPGVAQRTGATIYYVEMFPAEATAKRGKAPVLALMPVPGDVDVVIASELMEAGRALARGLVSSQTSLVFSTHRDYAIGEKIAMGDGRLSSQAMLEALGASGARLHGADLAAACAGAPLSAALFGALAASGALPVSPESFASLLREGRGAERNLAAFEAGRAAILQGESKQPSVANRPLVSGRGGVSRVAERIGADVPREAGDIARIGAERCADFQDWRYAHSYLDRISNVAAVDKEAGPGRGFRLTAIVTKRLAPWMTYEDAIRVADLKTRSTRFARVRDDVHAAPGQVVWFSEYLHPRAEEICDLLPEWLAKAVLSSRTLKNGLNAVLGGGRRVSTNRLRGFLPLWSLAKLRPWRRASHRFSVEQRRIEAWLARVREIAVGDYETACELAEAPVLLKGYGETYERGVRSFESIMAALGAVRASTAPAATLKRLLQAALADEEGAGLARAIAALSPADAGVREQA